MTHPKQFAMDMSPPWGREWKGNGCWLTPPSTMGLQEATDLAEGAGLKVLQTKTTMSGVRKLFCVQS